MHTNEILIKVSETLKLEIKDMVQIFELGGITLNEEQVNDLLTDAEGKPDNAYETLEYFLNGLIIYKRGVREESSEKSTKPSLSIIRQSSMNNVVMKKMKIALSLTNDDLIEILKKVNVVVTNRELSPMFRAEGHKHYKKCTDLFLNQFLEGLSK